MNWQDDLSRIQKYFQFEPMDVLTLRELEQSFRELHPGPWKMTWNRRAVNYSYSRLRAMNEFMVHIVFESEQDQIWWMLQNA